MGSVVAIDAGGSHWPRYGSARRHVEELQIVLADGDGAARRPARDRSKRTTAIARDNGDRRPAATVWSNPLPG